MHIITVVATQAGVLAYIQPYTIRTMSWTGINRDHRPIEHYVVMMLTVLYAREGLIKVMNWTCTLLNLNTVFEVEILKGKHSKMLQLRS